MLTPASSEALDDNDDARGDALFNRLAGFVLLDNSSPLSSTSFTASFVRAALETPLL